MPSYAETCQTALQYAILFDFLMDMRDSRGLSPSIARRD